MKFWFLLCLFIPMAASADSVVNTTGFHVHDTGKGSNVLILAGGPGFTAWNLLPLQQAIAKRHRALLFDMRGVGDQVNLPISEARLLDQWVQDIEAVRVEKGIEQWTLVGHSWGGLMALLYAKAYPEHVQKLVLLNPVDPEKRGLADILDRINERQQQHKPIDWDTGFDSNDSMLSRTSDEVKLYQIRQVLPTYFADFAQGERYAAQFTAADFYPDINSRIWQEYDAQPISKQDALDLSSKSVTFADCDQDLLMPENQQGLQAYFPKMRSKVFKQCAHFPWVEQPKAFYPWLYKTLAGKS